MVAAGVTGAGIAMPLFGAVGAQAAEVQTWDRVAECESGGMWSANEGNGFYGGLQITLDMWKKYGGQRYAPRPDLASRSQQIAVAQAILADRGPDAWPSCALSAGLADLGDALGVTPGAGQTPESKESTGVDDPTTGESSDSSGRSDKAGTPDSSGESDTPDKAGAPDSSAPDGESGGASGDTSGGASDGTSGDSSAGSGGASHKTPSPDRDAPGAGEDSTSAPTGRHRGAPDAREGRSGDETDQARPSGRHASRDDADRTETPPQPLGRADYTVRSGDNLSGIAEEQEVDGGWPELYEANDSVIGTDPDLIHPGQRLDLSVR
ncbi:transglycosylase family protein [Streptomyces sparsogenes]|uniref:transglycosylase family protein n=1 Tax=Streptomyces sparsogenes TaxID=67365 RepID=UPI0033C69522